MRRPHRLVSILAVICLVSSSATFGEPTLPVDINVSGSRGNDGADGTSHSGSASRSSDGRRGGDASPSTAGEDAGDIRLRLEVATDANGRPIPTEMIVRGTVRRPRDSRGEATSRRIRIGSSGDLSLRARGGDGGHGGDGGDGEDGGRGYDGADATRFSDGKDGGPGGDGGDGGRGTSGSAAGAGGEVIVRVGEDDTHLVMLVTSDVAGGEGGNAGSHGTPGSGGSGGSGGSSYSWTTYRTEHYTDYETDSNGKSRSVSRTRQVPEHHSNPGGSSGSSGSSGSRPTSRLVDGADGTRGSFTIEVGPPEGAPARTYSSRYDVRVDSYGLTPGSRNGIFEPGERVRVGDIVVRNTGGMPTPPNHPVTLFLENSDWVVAEPVQIRIPRSLAPGESLRLSEHLEFDIPDTVVARVGDRFVAGGRVVAGALLPAVSRRFEGGSRSHDFDVTFPVEVTPILGMNTLLPGQVTRVRWSVRNVSSREIGFDSEEVRRAVATRLRERGSGSGTRIREDRPILALYDSERTLVEDDLAFLTRLGRLAPGEVRDIDGYIGMLPDAPAHHRGALGLDLSVGRPRVPTEERVVQQRDFLIQSAETYSRNPGHNFLLVVNHNTTADEIAAWRDVAASLGTGMDVMNLSFEGDVDFRRIFTDFQWRSMVLLDQTIDMPGGESARARDFMSKLQFLRAATEHNIRVMVSSDRPGDVDDYVRGLLIPGEQWEQRMALDSPADFRRYVRAQLRPGDSPNPAVPISEFEFPVEDTFVFGTRPSAERTASTVRNAARNAQAELARTRPDARYYVFHEPETPTEIPGARFGQRVRMGRVVVAESVDQRTHSGLFTHTEARRFQSPKHIRGIENVERVALAAHIDDKISALNRYVNGELNPPRGMSEEAFGEALVRAIVTDVAAEQRALVTTIRNYGFNDGMLEALLPTTRAVATGVLTQPTEVTGRGRAVLSLVSRMRMMSRNQVRWWQRILPGMRSRRLERLVVPMTERMMDANFGGRGSPLRTQADAALTQMVTEMRAGNERFDSNTVMTRLRERGVVSDQHIDTRPEDRVLSMADRTARATADRAAEETRFARADRYRQAQADYLQEWSCGAGGCRIEAAGGLASRVRVAAGEPCDPTVQEVAEELAASTPRPRRRARR